MTLAVFDESCSFQDALAAVVEFELNGDEHAPGAVIRQFDVVLGDHFHSPAYLATTGSSGLYTNVNPDNDKVVPTLKSHALYKKAIHSWQESSRKINTTRKAEVDNLRDEIKVLDAQLSELKKQSALHKVVPIHQRALEPDFWKEIAARQKTQLEHAGTNNVLFRAKIKSQLHMTKSLVRVLQRREAALVSDYFVLTNVHFLTWFH